MKFTSIIASFGIIVSAVSAATPSPNSQYYLQVIGGNDLINGRRLRLNGTTSLGVTAGPYASSDHMVTVSPGGSSAAHQIFIAPTSSSNKQLALVGPSGRGVDSLQVVTPDGNGGWVGFGAVGSEVLYNHFQLRGMLLRNHPDFCVGHWIAARVDHNGHERWVPYFIEVGNSNYNLLSNYVIIDLEFVQA